MHEIHRVQDFRYLRNYIIEVVFEDNTHQIIDFEKMLEAPIYSALRDQDVFQQARIDPEVHTLVWPNGADFDPETLYNWPQYAARLEERARNSALIQMK